MGLLVLFTFALLLLITIGTLVLIYGMTHPERRTFASALGCDMATEPAELGMEAEAVDFRFDDNTVSPGWVIKGQHDNGVTLVLTHGWSDSRYGTLQRAPLFAPYATRIVVYDMRGHGDSTAKRCGLSRLETSDLLAIMDQIDDGGRFVLWGSSMGAGITIAAAAAECETRRTEQHRGDQRDRLIAVIAEGPFRFPTQAAASHLSTRRVPPQPLAWLAEKHFAFWQGETRQSFDRALHAAKITCPLLVMHGSIDEICPIASSRAIADAAPDSRFVVFDGATHENLARFDESRYRSTLDVFFAEVGVKKSDKSSRSSIASDQPVQKEVP